MIVTQSTWTEPQGWSADSSQPSEAQLVIATGGIDQIGKTAFFEHLRALHPKASIVSCSTAGEIAGDQVLDQSIVATAIQFEHTQLKTVCVPLSDFSSSFECGAALQKQLLGNHLCHILLISDGIAANGDELVNGITENLPKEVIVTGGLAADNGRFQETLVGANSVAKQGNVVAIGFYSQKLTVRHGSRGGWDKFGPIREITRSVSNKLYELDGEPALAIYKNYLGEKAKDLPGAALLFQLSILLENGEVLVRTILSINEEEGSMTFAGDMPAGAKVQLMLAHFDRLIDGATAAAEDTAIGNPKPQWVFMVSCVGRKLVLSQRIDEEIEGIVEVLGPKAIYSGFYSNGEISPLLNSNKCSLHNQTMTITTYSEH
jgi:hypothetical protein